MFPDNAVVNLFMKSPFKPRLIHGAFSFPKYILNLLHIVYQLWYTLFNVPKFIYMATKPLTKFLNVRLTPSDHKAFHRKAEKFGQPSDVLREIVQAFNTDRLVIQPPVTPKESLYVTRIEN
jgi:hypothetical protein